MSHVLWRPMRAADVTQVHDIANQVHIAHPERPEVFSERLWLFPAGCFVLEDAGGQALGYAISHPWHGGAPPELDTLIDALPAEQETHYIHDIALRPAARRHGAAREIVARLILCAGAQGRRNLALVAVNGTAAFWQTLGFRRVAGPALTRKLRSYGEDAAYMVLALG